MRNQYSTAKKRAAVCAAITSLETAADWHVEESHKTNRSTRLRFNHGGYVVVMDFDGATHMNGFLAHWYTELRSKVTYPRDFPAGLVNQFHFQKATTYAANLQDFLDLLSAGFDALKVTA